MEDMGKLLYEEEIKERRVQGELSTNHIGIFICLLVLILTWTVYGVQVWRGIGVAWLVFGLIISLILTIISLIIIDKLARAEFTQYWPIKVYENGIMMPPTPFDRVLWKKQPFIFYNNLSSIRLIRAPKPDHMDLLIIITKSRKSYLKRYNRDSKETKNILENVRKAFPQARIEISE
jgi:hypothetical protein